MLQSLRSKRLPRDSGGLGSPKEAEIVETGVLIACDPSLRHAVLAAVHERGVPAAAAILDSAEEQAQIVAAIDDARLAERADDILKRGPTCGGVGRAAPQGPSPRMPPGEPGRYLLARIWAQPRSRILTCG